MSTDKTNERSDQLRDPTDDKYLELEKRLGGAEESTLAAGIAAENKASEAAIEAAREHTRPAIADIHRRHGDGRG
jgi:hypothetical protein